MSAARRMAPAWPVLVAVSMVGHAVASMQMGEAWVMQIVGALGWLMLMRGEVRP